MSSEKTEAQKVEERNEKLRGSIRDMSPEELKQELFEKTLYANDILAKYNSMETQFRRLTSEKAVRDRDVMDFRRTNNVLREQNEMLTEVVKLLVGVKPAAELAFTVANVVVQHALDAGAVSTLPESADLIKKLLVKKPAKKQKLVRKK